jgi:hypothetical protein
VTLAGTDENGDQVTAPEVWNGSGWTELLGATRTLPYYPRTFVAPNGLVFYAGELRETAYLDPSGSGSWTPVASSLYGQRDYGSAVMYRPGKVLIVGGSDPPDGVPTNTAEVIDLTDPLPVWRSTGAMAAARRQFNATLLPDGRVVATGGTSVQGFSDPSGAVHAAEAWDPTTDAWTTWASSSVTRVYHSTTILYPMVACFTLGAETARTCRGKCRRSSSHRPISSSGSGRPSPARPRRSVTVRVWCWGAPTRAGSLRSPWCDWAP